VLLKIFNPLGQEIRTLINTTLAAGYHEVKWDGKNDLGQPVSPGIYLYQLKAGDFHAVKKMILLE
jgi:flagellar hook assembly protein FlgD